MVRYGTGTPKLRYKSTCERGQSTVLAVAVVGLAVVLALSLAQVGQTLVRTARNQTAADAIALAVVTEPNDAGDLVDWYRDRDIEVWFEGDDTVAGDSGSSARARAALEQRGFLAAPVLVAIVARAEQLVGRTLGSARVGADSVKFAIDDGFVFATIASEFGLCQDAPGTELIDQVRFSRC